MSQPTDAGGKRPRRRGEVRRELLLAVVRRLRAEGRPLSYELLAQELGVAPSTVDHHLKWLRDQGVIRIHTHLYIEIVDEDGDGATDDTPQQDE